MFGRGDSFDDLFNELNNMFGRHPFGGRFGIHGKNNVEKGKMKMVNGIRKHSRLMMVKL